MREHYKLVYVPMSTDHLGEFRTAALLTCGLCGDILAGMGGPGDGAVCKPCGDALRTGGLAGTVRRED